MVQRRMSVNSGLNFSGLGLPPAFLPFPEQAGTLFASHVYGTEPAKLAGDDDAIDFGPRWDFSRHGRHLATAGTKTFTAWAMLASLATTSPLTTYSLNQMLAAMGVGVNSFTMVVFANAPSDAKAVTLLRSLNIDPLCALSLLPQIAGGTLRATVDEGDPPTQASVIGLPGILGANSVFAGCFAPTQRGAFAKGPGGVMLSGVDNTADNIISDGVFHGGIETAGAGAGVTSMFGWALYAGPKVADDIIEMQVSFHDWHQAAESGLTFYTEPE